MTTAVLSTRPTSLDIAQTASVYLKETKYEFLKLMRARTFSLSVIGFPIMFYILFGISMNRGASVDGQLFAKYLLATYSCFGLIGAALFGIGVGLASERAQGWLEVKQSSPMPPLAYLLAKGITAMAFGLIIVSLLLVLGVTAAHVHVTLREVVQLMGVTAAGAIPFASMGLLLALLVPITAAPGVVNMIYLPMSFASGLWMPLSVLPHWVGVIARFLPTYHLAQLALHVFGYASGPMAIHWEALAGFTVLLLGLSAYFFKRAAARA
ncbi:MAG TPA: ABC transporter permease [Acidisarcina sp.]